MDLYSPPLTQPILFEIQNTSTGAVEFFPAVWNAAEALSSPDVEHRRLAIQQLRKMGVARLSPLIAYLAATRLTDPDLGVRGQVVSLLGDVCLPDAHGNLVPENVRRRLVASLSQMRTCCVFALLEVVAADGALATPVFHLLKTNTYAGGHLVSILSNRQIPLKIRQQAVHFVGLVGYLDAIPALERLENRLEARLNGQQAMAFAASSSVVDESSLVPLIHKTLDILKSP